MQQPFREYCPEKALLPGLSGAGEAGFRSVPPPEAVITLQSPPLLRLSGTAVVCQVASPTTEVADDGGAGAGSVAPLEAPPAVGQAWGPGSTTAVVVTGVVGAAAAVVIVGVCGEGVVSSTASAPSASPQVVCRWGAGGVGRVPAVALVL